VKNLAKTRAVQISKRKKPMGKNDPKITNGIPSLEERSNLLNLRRAEGKIDLPRS